MKTITLYIILLFSTLLLQSEEDTDYLVTKKYSVGIFGSTSLNSHTTDFKQLVGIPNCCNGFKSGSAIGLNLSIVYQLPINEQLELDIRPTLLNLNGDLISTQQIPIDDDENAITEHLISTEISSIGLDVGLNYYFLEKIHLKSSLSYSYIYSGRYNQEERLIKPSNFGTFENGLRIRNEQDGEIPELNSSFYSINLGIGYNLELNRKGSYLLIPEFGIRFGLNDINSQSWKVNQITIGVALLYNKSSKGLNNPIIPYD